jgi:hypothetical protein
MINKILPLFVFALGLSAQTFPFPGPGNPPSGGGGATPAALDSQKISNTTTGTTPAMVNTGATSLVVSVGCYLQDCSTLTITSSPANTFTCSANIAATGAGATANHMLCYKLSPTVSGAQTVSFSGCTAACSIWAASFSGTATLDGSIVGAGSSGSTASQQGGSLTTGTNNELVVSGLGAYCTAACDYMTVINTVGIDSSFTILQMDGSNAIVDGGIAYKVVTLAGAVNPAWLATAGANQFTAGAVVHNVALNHL